MSKPKIGNYRWTICTLLFFATTINYIDRQVIGLLKPTLEDEFNWTEVDYGYIVTAFTAMYALGYTFFGRFIDSVGTKIGYAVSVTLWSIAAVLHGVVKSTFGFIVARGALGLAESGNFPAAIKATAEWFPKKERALATGIFNSGASIGPVIAPLLVPLILGLYGWRAAFYITGAIGFIWVIFWWIFYEIPQKQKRISKTEYEYIHKDTEEAEEAAATKPKWKELMKSRRTWAFILGKAFTDPIWWFFLFWIPSYFSDTFQLDLSEPSWHLAVVYGTTTLGSISGGFISSFLIKKGWNVLKARKFTLLLFALSVTAVFLARSTTNVWVAVAVISIATGSHQGWSANLYTIVSDMFPKKSVSTVIGIGGTAGTVASTIFPLFIGALLAHYKGLGNIVGGYNFVFIICGSSYLVAWVIIHLLTRKVKTA